MSNKIPPLEGPISKTKRKKQMHDLQDFGEMLLDEPASLLAKLPLDERMREAVAEWKRIKAMEAKRRHVQYVGRILRESNGEEIRAAYEDLTDPSRLVRVERLREQITTDEEALKNFIAEHPDMDVQHLRQLIRNARREREEIVKAQEAGVPPGNIPKSASFQKLFQFLRQVTGN